MKDSYFNSSIICVDDEKDILKAYSDALSDNNNSSEDITSLLSERRKRTGDQTPIPEVEIKKISYNLFLAGSGEEAIEIVNKELSAGRHIAAGFFDMVMHGGGIDGKETIKKILEMDDQILCAVVTAYSDISPAELRTLFKRQDNWLYFNKPFSAGELSQTALHLVTAWNQRRREEFLVSNLEKMQKELINTIKLVQKLSLM